MEGDNFLEQFQNKDLSGIKKFNFKKAKATKVEEKDPPHLESNVESTTLDQYQNKAPTKKIVYSKKTQSIPWLKKSNLETKKTTIIPHVSSTIGLSSKLASCNSTSDTTNNELSKSPSKKFTFKQTQNQATNHTLSSKMSYLSKEEQKDSILDSLYKNTLSNKRGIDLDSPVLENHSKPQSLSNSPNHHTSSKEVSSVSKYFSNQTKKLNSLSPSKSPFKKLLETQCNPLKCDNKITKPYSLDEHFHSSEKKDTQVGESTSKPITISDSSSATSTSPVIKPKKFVFKKKTLGSSKDLSLSLENSSFDESTNQQKEPVMSTYDQVSNSKSNTALNTKSTGDKDLNEKNKKEPDSVSQSLEVTGEDYMDDEEFERQFGSLADQFDESMVNETLTNKSHNKITKKPESTENTEELLNEITNINWEEDLFEEETVETGFKDRDDDSTEFQGNYEHSEVMMEVLHQKFGLRSFRPHQREIINASLTLHDCFVLMPTGGGKSLCYQLPAVLTPGVTVVVSPLRALISDQVDKLNALDIAAAHLCSDVSQKESEQIYHKLSTREPGIKLLYLTPEKINASRQIITILDALYQRGKLTRFVIDECHCLSAWGHDFRPDYKQLSMLRKNYKDVPIICLTATATKRVETDVTNILGLKKVKRFIRSFNRPNIKYQVIPKSGKGTTEEIATLIKCKFPKMSGIVYCLGRKDCDLVAEEFNNLGIRSKPYHAGMNDKVREVIQREWMQDRFHVIVATIAFGMGIDKPDVRFVIHNSIPKSVEAFYQESGRAGRDGEVSYSYLYYSYGDAMRLLRLMQMDRNVTSKTMEAHKENLNQMVGFAENMVDCRRHLQLIHLGEHFDRKICMRNKATICDNCENFEKYKTVDVTKAAKQLCELVKDLTNKENVTMLYVADIYKGSKIKKIVDRGHNKHRWHAAGASMDRNDVQRVLKQLILKNILNEFCTYAGDFPVVYLQVGPKFYQFYNSDTASMEISVCTDRQGRKTEAMTRAERATASNSTSSGWVDVSKPSTSKGTAAMGAAGPAARAAVQKQVPARLQAARKLQLVQLKTQCHEELLEECRRLAMERNLTLSSVMNLSAIKTMSETLPKTKEEMLKIQHVTNANYSKYGEFFLAITTKFRAQTDALAPLAELSSEKDWGDLGIVSDDDEERIDDFNSSDGGGSRRGVKRKSSWRGKKRGGFGNRWKKSKKSPKGKASGWTSKRGGGKGRGGLGLMPLHFK